MPGDLAETSPVDLCLHLAGERATGTLALASPHGDAVLVFADGRLAGARPPDGSEARLGERLVAVGRLARPDLDTALAAQSDGDGVGALGQLLVDRGLASADEVRLFVQEQAIDTLLDAAGWFEGTWDFEPATGVARTGAGPGMPVDRVLVEVRRRAAERERIAEQVPSPGAVPTVVAGGGAAPPDAAAVRVLEAVDGERSVQEVAAALGIGLDETMRHVFRMALQGRVTCADTMGTTPSLPPTTTPPAPVTEDAPLHASTTTGSPPVQLADDGWAARRAGARTVADEPEPWVGWANGAPTPTPAPPAAPAPPPAGTAPSAPTPTPEVAPTSPPGSGAPLWSEVPATAGSMSDGDTRRAMFSELHEVGRAHPGIGASPAPPTPEPAPEPEAPRANEAPRAGEARAAASTDEPAPAASAPLSRSDVSDLLRELHALNLDD